MSTEESDIADEESGEQSKGGIGSLIDYNRRLRDQLTEAKRAHQQESRDQKADLKDLTENLESLQQELDNQTALWKSKELELEEANQKARSELTEKVQELTASLKTLEKAKTDLEKGLSKAESRGGSLDKLKHSLLNQTRELRGELNALKSKCSEQEEAIEDLISERDELVTKLDELSGASQRIESLEKENQELNATLKKQAEQAAKAEQYVKESEARLAENKRLEQLAADKVKEAAEAIKKQEAAEKQAFESRRKLLDAYTEQESKDIVKTKLEETEAKLAETQTKLQEALKSVAEWEVNYNEMEEKLLYSSSRDNLKASLSSLAKRRSGG